METIDFPACCTAVIVKDFGESWVAEAGPNNYSEEQIENYLLLVEQMQKEEGNALITAITNSEQKKANKVLKKLGYSFSNWIYKEAHPETQIRLWYKAIV